MASTRQIQSPFFTKLLAEIRIIVYSPILSDFRGKNEQLVGALSSCKQMDSEMEKELIQAFLRNLTTTINEVDAKWNAPLPPFQVTHTPHTEDLKHDAINLDMALPYPAVQLVGGTHYPLRSVLPHSMDFQLKDFNFSFFHQDADLTHTFESNNPSSPASMLPFISLVHGAATRQTFPRVPRAQKVTLIMKLEFESFETIYRFWYHIWCYHLDDKGYDKKLKD
jgi:hypothetical protein